MTSRPQESQRREQHREGALRSRQPIPPELPREVLHVIQQLLSVQEERVAGVVVPRRIHRVVEHRRLAELLARQDGLERRPRGRVALVEIRVEVRPNRNEEIDARPDHGDEQRRDEEPRAEEHPGIGSEDIDQDRGRHQEAH